MNQTSEPTLQDTDLPPVFRAADTSSLDAQRQFLTAVRIRLIVLVAAGAFGFATWRTGADRPDWAGALASLCFCAAVIVEVYLLTLRPEQTWYEARAAAESVKTLTWRYAVGGEPFNIGRLTEEQTESSFLAQLDSVITELRHLNMSPPSEACQQITEGMRALRSKNLEERKRAYETARVMDQQVWYQRKAKWNRKRARQWTSAMLVFEVGGIGAAIAKTVGIIQGDLLIFAGAVVAAITAWLETKQHHTLATAYSVTSLELASVRTKIGWQRTEADWGKFVGEAEEAFSREHTLWKASRGIRSIP